jgi:hypothetical protein
MCVVCAGVGTLVYISKEQPFGDMESELLARRHMCNLASSTNPLQRHNMEDSKICYPDRKSVCTAALPGLNSIDRFANASLL